MTGNTNNRNTSMSFYYTHKKTIRYVVLMTLIMIPFQNCGKVPSLATGSDSSSGVPNVSPVPSMAMSQDQIDRQACRNNEATPSFNSQSGTSASMSIGLGPMAGHVASAPIGIVGQHNVKDPSIETVHQCSRYRNVSVVCAISSETGREATLSRAIALDGTNLAATATTPAEKASVIARGVGFLGCNILERGVEQTNVVGTYPNGMPNNLVRCISGTFQLAVKFRVQADTTTVESPTRYIQYTVNDGCWNETRLKDQVSSSPADFPRLAGAGSEVAIDGNWAAVLAPAQDLGSITGVGAVHLYNYVSGQWAYHSRIQPTDAQAEDAISSIALKGDTLVLGSSYRGTDGAVLIYKLVSNVWTRTAEVLPPRAQANQNFGNSVAFDGGHLFVGAPHYSRVAGDRAGAVYHFTINASGQATAGQTLEWTGAQPENRGFGLKLSVAGSYLAVGAPQALTRETLGAGAVSLYQYSGGSWTLIGMRLPPSGLGTGQTGDPGLRYGASVSVDTSGRVLVGAPGNVKNNRLNAGGAAYFATFGLSTPTKILTMSSEEEGELFGTGVALSTNGLFIGSPYRNSRAGIVNYYRFADLITTAFQFFSWNQTSNDAFGWSLGSSGSRVIVGARIKNDPNQSSGAAYIYDIK